MSENLTYCILSILGGAVFSALITVISICYSKCEKMLFLDMISDYSKKKDCYDTLFYVKNIGLKTIIFDDFAPLDKPQFNISDAFPIDIIMLKKNGFNNVRVTNIKGFFHLEFDYLKPGEGFYIIFHNHSSMTAKFYSTMIDGVELNFHKSHRLFDVLSYIAFPIINILMIILSYGALSYNALVEYFILGLVWTFNIMVNIMYYRLVFNRCRLKRVLKNSRCITRGMS